jgi:hypothetical protein
MIIYIEHSTEPNLHVQFTHHADENVQDEDLSKIESSKISRKIGIYTHRNHRTTEYDLNQRKKGISSCSLGCLSSTKI